MARRSSSKFDKKLILIPVGIIVIGFIINGIIKGRNEPKYTSEFNATVPDTSASGATTLKELKLYMDFSGSMRGYVDFAGMPAGEHNTLFSTVTMFLDNVETNYHIKTHAVCGGRQYEKNSFRDALQSKTVFHNNTTLLHQMIVNNTCQANDTTVVAIVSDMILSFGKSKVASSRDTFYNRTQLQTLKGYVHNAMTVAKANGLDAAILQYYSDFNGKYYFNYTENIKNGAAYKTQLMKDRPFYILLIGKEENLKSMLSKECMQPYNNIFTTFSIGESEYSQARYTIVENQTKYWIPGNQKGEKAGFTTTTNTDGFQTRFAVNCSGFKIPGYLSRDSKHLVGYANVGGVSDILYDVASSSLSFIYTTPAYKVMNNGETDVRIDIKDANVDWSAHASIDDDIAKSAEQMEGKTWGLQALMDGISMAYGHSMPGNEALVGTFSFSLYKSK